AWRAARARTRPAWTPGSRRAGLRRRPAQECGHGRALRRLLLGVEAALGGDPGHEESELGVAVGPLGSADRAAGPLPGACGALLGGAAAALVPALGTRGDPQAVQQVQGERWRVDGGCRG